jgi:hypothetical protein
MSLSKDSQPFSASRHELAKHFKFTKSLNLSQTKFDELEISGRAHNELAD